MISGEFTMRALILPVLTFIRNETGDQYNGRLCARTCRFNLAADLNEPSYEKKHFIAYAETKGHIN